MSKTFFLFAFICVSLYSSVNAQMFSVGDDSETRLNPFAPYLYVGVQPLDFNYTGNPNDPNAGDFSFSALVPHISFESGGLDIGLSLGNSITGLDDNTYFDLGIDFTNPFYFVRQPRFGLGIPIQLSTKITSVQNSSLSNQFSQTNLSAGAGAIMRYINPNKLNFSAHVIPSYGFSSASGGFIGGNVFSFKTGARLSFFDVLFGKNISLGYNYLFDSYDIENEEYDYDFNAHNVTLGISF